MKNEKKSEKEKNKKQRQNRMIFKILKHVGPSDVMGRWDHFQVVLVNFFKLLFFSH